MKTDVPINVDGGAWSSIVSLKKFQWNVNDVFLFESHDMENCQEFVQMQSYFQDIDNKSTVLIKNSKMAQSKPRWNEKCNNDFKKIHMAVKKYRKSGLVKYYLEIKKAEAVSKKTNKAEKRLYWKDRCSNITKHTPIGEVWKEVRRMKGGPLKSADSKYDEWVSGFICKNSPHTALREICENELADHQDTNYLMGNFSVRELKEKIISLRKSAGGLGKLTSIKLKLLPDELLEVITRVFNTAKNTRDIPEEWYDCKLIAIPKPHKNTNDEISKRPISIFSMWRRLFAKLMLERLEKWLEKNKLLSESQFADGLLEDF